MEWNRRSLGSARDDKGESGVSSGYLLVEFEVLLPPALATNREIESRTSGLGNDIVEKESRDSFARRVAHAATAVWCVGDGGQQCC